MMLWAGFFNVAIIATIVHSQLYGLVDTNFSLNKLQNPAYEGVKSVKGGKRPVVSSRVCTEKPNPPNNGVIKCSTNGECIAICNRGYKFPKGSRELAIACENDNWYVVGANWSSIPHCEPICKPNCLNNGICVAPHHCNCPEKFTGPQCQFENKPCPNRPAPVLNAHSICNSESCTISCMKNFTFPDGTAITNVVCKNGNWEPTRQDWASIPDCKAICNPPCENGGNCLPLNICQCPQAYTGPQCQYSVDTCNGEKIGFNGGFHCQLVNDIYSCNINCPDGIEFEFPPASTYICDYETGIFNPQPIPQCNYNPDIEEPNHTWTYQSIGKMAHVSHSWSFQGSYGSTTNYNSHNVNMTSNTVLLNSLENNVLFVEEKKPVPKTCFTWGGMHYKTFDDNVFSFASQCPYILLQEAQNRLFTITVENSPTCKNLDCFRIIKIFIQNKEYILLRNQEGVPEFRTPEKLLPIPAQLSALRVHLSAHFIVVQLDSFGLKLKWDGELLIQVEALESMWNRTVGLCGSMNGDANDDLMSKNGDYPRSVAMFATSWQTGNIGETCDDNPKTDSSCEPDSSVTRDAIQFCTKLLSDRRFQICSNTIGISQLQEACLWDYCSCIDYDRRACACNTMDVYVRQCAHKKVTSLAGWRNNDTCPIVCNGGRVYMPCGPRVEPSCWTEAEKEIDTEHCEEGCFCPEGTVSHGGRCIHPDECPCRLRGHLFQPGKTVKKNCNTCTCLAGKWICTQANCGARCAAIGDPHYVTFDGKHYDFMGKCKYYLMKGDDYSIEGENVPCSGAISEEMGLVPADAPSCTKTVTINYKDVSLKLKQHRQVLINGNDLTTFPRIVNGIRIHIASSIFLIVHLPNGLNIWWDGISRVYINAPSEFRGKTKGLCGTFSENQKDDFVTPDGDIETMAVSFANKWKSDELCPDLPEKESDHPCDLDPQKRANAKQYCSYLLSDVFAGCHWYVDPDVFYKDCLFDMCSCKVEVESCLCPVLAAYAKDCAAAGIKLLWRQDVKECMIHCPGNQVYQICGNSCARSCQDITSYQDCKQECVEGCNCPEGETLNIHGECIPIGQCPCIYGDIEFSAGYKEVRPGHKTPELCTCAGGVWNCREATQNEIQEYPTTKNLSSCAPDDHQKVTDCVPLEPRTCRNMHKPIQEPAICKSGCVCMPGYILDEPKGKCIKEESCPCRHGGQSYEEMSVIQNECNTCECTNGTWKCTDRTCAGVCSAWGDSHYKTFDGKIYDFQGLCNYILVKGSLSPQDSFEVSVQNVPCGTTGVACSKSIILTIGSNESPETIVLTRGEELPVDNFKRLAMRTAGLFVFVDVPDMGLTVQWDKGTRVYIRLEPAWKGRTKGLCGDYNDNSVDDFKTPSGGISEASANLFGDSWKKNEYCPEPKDVRDPCEQHPERNSWAVQKCGILKSSIFQPCHSEVEVNSYLHNCIFDTCGCDTGGDCECLCTALAAYAQECNAKGVLIKWRSQELCPIQCDESCSSYSPCITTCPRETCNNLMTLNDKYHLCNQDTCVEGCFVKPCPQNQVYSNDSYAECVPKEVCKTPCTTIDGVVYYEGDSVKDDGCQICFCSRGKVLCKGEPCMSSTVSSTIQKEQPENCKNGWTSWINSDSPLEGKKFDDVEPLPSSFTLLNTEGSAACDKKYMIDIQCRSVVGHLSPEATGLDVECTLERGLYCRPQPDLPCIDFEISVLCQCSWSTTETSKLSSIPEISYEECNVENPNKLHPTDCHLFYQCVPGLNGSIFVEKSCGESMLYNPKTQICDWPQNVMIIRPDCLTLEQTTSVEKFNFSTTTSSTFTEKCKPDEIWDECAINCNRACNYYRYTLIMESKCSETSGCISGCVSMNKPQCSPNKFWRDARTCVDEANCTCRSHDGHAVIPGAVFKESDCEICQCINNYYTCDRSLCTTAIKNVTTAKSSTEPFTESSVFEISSSFAVSTVVIPSTVSPPAYCTSNKFVPLIKYLNDQVTLNASSSRGSAFQPEHAAMNGDTDFWEPEYTTTDQWLDIKFQQPEPIYGISIQGSLLENKFVTSYKVLFSEDGHSFSYILDDEKEPRVFRGPVNEYKAVQQVFYEPIEARIVRINPLSWHNGIAVQVELLGCLDMVTTSVTTVPSVTETLFITTAITEQRIIPDCDEPMGLDNGLILPSQVSVSSSSTDLLPNLQLSSAGVWHPLLDNPHQFVKLDFLEPRKITGIVTKGGEGTWTTVYKVFYSNDDSQWNPIIDENGSEKEFLGNFDSTTVKKNYFDRPLNARYLKVQPVKWHEQIGLKLEALGCFLPYPPQFETTPVQTATISTIKQAPIKKCNICNGVKISDTVKCECSEPFWWNGDSCVTQQECPCVVEHMLYNVGATYIRKNCQECVCTLGGIPFCQPMKCTKPCTEPEMRPVINELCNCVCKPCPTGTRRCPTNDVCVAENLWCNGIQDCPDDETDCPIIEITTMKIESPTFTPTSVTPIICPKPVCPPLYKLKPHRPQYRKTFTKSGVKSWFRDFYAQKRKSETRCEKFTCVPVRPPPTIEECPKISCPADYTIIYEKMSMHKLQKCPEYTCKPPLPEQVVCNVTGRTFNTFDKLEYKYDICNHILAREMFSNKWYITLEKQCNSHTGQCMKILVVVVDENVVVLYPDMHVDINEYSFTPKQIARIDNNLSPLKISTVGDLMYLSSKYYEFWVIWDINSNVKIGIPAKLSGQVNGLCGYFDGHSTNDRQLPDGSQARSTVEFGNSWAMEGVPECDPQVCPYDLQAESLKICNSVKETSLAQCSNVMNLEKFVSGCIESTCNCLRSNQTYDDCRCRLLTSFITECQASDLNIDLSTWRSIHDCPAACPPPLVHKDCFRNKCETSCVNLRQKDACPVMQGVCFSGCFCPEGTIRNGDACVPPTHCKDCNCELFGNIRLITFDRKNIKFDGNCTYVFSRDTIDDWSENKEHTYQVLVSNGVCNSGKCIEAIIILYKGHVVKIKEGVPTQVFEVEVDGSSVLKFPYSSSWLIVEQTPTEKLQLLIPPIQLGIISYQPNFTFALTVPSHIFGGAMEGLCGNCNEDRDDDTMQQDGKITDDMQQFGSSWLVNVDNTCAVNNQTKCVLPPADQDPCRRLLDAENFGICHSLVDPMPYLAVCQDNMCTQGGYCDSFEAYSRKCQQMGVCLTWRTSEICPYSCPPDLVYEPCGSTCKQTCDTINEMDNPKCTSSYEEGCFCPQNFVFHNNTCMPREKCLLCDEQGHVEGDVWFPDVCTKCSCNKKVISCEKRECPTVDTICEENMTPLPVNGTEEDCCTKYLCIPKMVTTVAPFCPEEPQLPDCGYGQITKVSVDSDGCKKFICECVPSSECPILNEVNQKIEELQPGFVQVKNTSGCCPRLMNICDPQTCPSTPTCPEYYELQSKVEGNSCCATYECVPPTNLCLYNVESESGIELMEQVVAKKLGEKWMNGNCTSCICEHSETGPNPRCTTTECVRATNHPDVSDFVLEEVLLKDECCPNIERTACKDKDKVYNVNEVWQPNPEDSCTLMRCVEVENGIQKQTQVQECVTLCDPGFEYQPTSNRSVNCCGRCVPVACVIDNEVRNVGEEWFSSDFCTKHTCKSNNESIYVESLTESCPQIDPREETEFEIEKRYVPGQCCPQFIKTGCRSNDIVYKPGDKWKSPTDKCITEICALEANITKYKEVEVCNTNCTPGWTYVEKAGECCGECKETYCVVEDTLYEPGAVWLSADNCTTFACVNQGDQLSISSSFEVCPDISDCPANSIYKRNCCLACDLHPENLKTCAVDILKPQNTIGMFSVQDGTHGLCKNLGPIDGVTECRGNCLSTTYFDNDKWMQVVDCRCCQPTNHTQLTVELICENYTTITKQVMVPVSCTCSACTSSKGVYVKGGVKG